MKLGPLTLLKPAFITSIWGTLSWAFLITLTLSAIIIPLSGLWDPNTFNPNLIGEPLAPSVAHLFGTDDLGRDILIRCIYGSRISLAVGAIAMVISISIGLSIGLISGYAKPIIDTIIMRVIDLLMAIPTIFLILIIQTILTPSIWNVITVIGFTSWMGVARIVRAEVLSLKEQPFVTAAKARNIPSPKILFKHILPHTLNPVIVAAMLGMGSAILTESVLSFLGMGIQPPDASWGNMLMGSLSYMKEAPWMAIFPGLLITLTVLALNFIGDDLRTYFNPKEQR